MKKIIIIGAGLSGCTTARLLAEKGFNVEIYEKTDFIGGSCFDCYDQNNVLIHKFGPHIFHTSYKEVWDFVNRFSKFNSFKNQVLVEIDNKLVQMPINFNSIKSLFPNDVDFFINEVTKKFGSNLSVSIQELKDSINDSKCQEIIQFLYNKVYANYTSKMWDIPIDKIDPNILKRVKVNLDYNWNYFPNDLYQGLPVDGYTKMFENMIDHPNIKLYKKVDALKHIKFNNNRVSFKNEVDVDIFYSGAIDDLFDNKYSELQYRSLNIVFENFNTKKYQDVAVINYPAHKHMTRICEYKHMTMQESETTTISKEYPGWYNKNLKEFNKRFYPISNDENILKFRKYLDNAQKFKNLILIGRLALYKYFDMDDAIHAVFNIIYSKY